jgi:hypothetical protein
MESGRGFGPFQKSRAKKSSAEAQAANSVSPAVVTQYGWGLFAPFEDLNRGHLQ